MSIILSVKINDGIVMAADSATTFPNGQIYDYSNKLLNLIKGVPVEVMTCGAAGVGNASNITLLKDLRERLTGQDKKWRLNVHKYTVESVAERVRDFFKEKSDEAKHSGGIQIRICGYSAGRPLPEVWEVACREDKWAEPSCIQPEQDFGIRWDGEYEVLDRVVLGVGIIPDSVLVTLGASKEQALEFKNKVSAQIRTLLIMPAAPIQDAIDLARFLVETTKGYIRFAVNRQKTVGGPTEIAAITKHEGFKWIQRKHFYPADLN